MFNNAVDLFKIFGFKVRIDPSWLLVAALIIWSLSNAYFPDVLPGLTPYEYVALGTVSMLGLFASLILHELSHSLVARVFGLKIGSITLFIFGGVAELESEPKSPKSEFWIAIAGPLMSFALAGFSYAIAIFLMSIEVSKPLVAIFQYLAFINLVLASFNLIPAFPLDGGRIFRAALWYFRNDIFSATKVASAFGSAFGFLLIVTGVFSIFSTNMVGGLWQILIGFFVLNASRNSYQQLLIASALKDRTVGSIMTSPVFTARPEDTVRSVINKIILKRNLSFVPVAEGDHLLGFVSTSVLKDIEPENWDQTKLADVYVASSNKNTVSPDLPLEKIFKKMIKEDQRKLLVVENGSLVGVIALADLMTFLSIQSGLGFSQPNNASNRNSAGLIS